MNELDHFQKEFNSILNSTSFIDPVLVNSDINKSYIDIFTTKQQKDRDQEITKLLSLYVNGYGDKVKYNKKYKFALVTICVLILIAFAVCFIILLCKNINSGNSIESISGAVQLVSICVTFLGLIIGLLQTITKYVFPQEEEQYITRIVEIIQQNDLENKKENIKVQGSSESFPFQK